MSESTRRRAELLDRLSMEARRTGSVSSMHNRAAARAAGIGETDWECLDLLDWTGPLPAGELARRLGLTSGAVTGLLDRLEALGAVRRLADPTDRRHVMAALCPEEALPSDTADVAAVFQGLSRDMDDINDRFDDDQLESIVDWLQSANEAVERSIERFRNVGQRRG